MHTMLVRITPHDPRRGCEPRFFAGLGISYRAEEGGWYRVDRGIGEYLRRVRRVPGDPRSPLAFEAHDEGRVIEGEEAI